MAASLPLGVSADGIGRALLAGVDTAVTQRWNAAIERARLTTGATLDERVSEVTATFVRELTSVGAVSGGVAVVPGAGTATAVATAVADLGWFTLRVSDLVLTIAAIHGHDHASVEQRRTWVLSILLFGDTAVGGLTNLASEFGTGLGRRATDVVPVATMRALNLRLGRAVARRYGTKRGAVALLRILPFGMGAVVGGGANYLGVKAIARQAHVFFGELPHALPELAGPPH